MAVGWLLPWHMIRNTYEESQTEPVSHAGKPILASAPCLLVIDPPNKSCGHSQLCSLRFPPSTNRLFVWRCSAANAQASFRPILTKAWVQKSCWTSSKLKATDTPLSTLVYKNWMETQVFLDKAQINRAVITTLYKKFWTEKQVWLTYIIQSTAV